MGTDVPNFSIDSLDMVAGLLQSLSANRLKLGMVPDVHERSPDWSRSDGIATNALFTNDLVTQCTHEANHGTLGSSIVN